MDRERADDMSISLRKLESAGDYQRMADLEFKIWGIGPIPLHQTITAGKNGGVALGAFDREELVGFSYGFAGYAKGEAYLCSHMLGIDPAYQNRGLGYKLKLQQAEEARELGYNKICWTYDPLESRNAYLNIAKLGAICSRYVVDCYGEMNDNLNKGLPSDRFNVEWYINSKHLQQNHTGLTSTAFQADFALFNWSMIGGEPTPGAANRPEPKSGEYLFMPIPVDYRHIKKTNPDLTLRWRMIVREVCLEWFSKGWAVADIIRREDEPVQYYVLVPRNQLAIC